MARSTLPALFISVGGISTFTSQTLPSFGKNHSLPRPLKRVSRTPLQHPALTVASPPAMSPRTVFRKYHGLGNDFILIDNRGSSQPVLDPHTASTLCARHTGVGADGVIFLLPPEKPTSDFSMRIYNSDGTEPEMCGNGIRCLARFAVDLNITSRNPGSFVVDTLAGVIVPQLVEGCEMVKVDMGEPVLKAEHIPVELDSGNGDSVHEAEGYVHGSILVNDRKWDVTCVSMGNPHCITFVSEELCEALSKDLEQKGPLFEYHSMFPARTNTEFVVQRSETHFDMLVWERGAGRTMACGTGACAVLAAAVLTGRAKMNYPTKVTLPGGDLIIEWDRSSNHIFMTGPAQLVFTGTL